MSQEFRKLGRPRGLSRLFLRAPIWLYRARLGWLLGQRFVLLTHIGRKSGLTRQTVLEIVRYDPTSGNCIVASGWGMKSDWVQNILADSKVTIQLGSKSSMAVAERLSPDVSAETLLDYSRRNPRAMRTLAGFMGYPIDGSEESILALGRNLPMFIFKPFISPK
jgi:deazaflavin-dependent oxidoreductase (nitroreductase family)